MLVEVEGVMEKVTYDKDVTALLVIDPYKDFISEGGKLWHRLKAVAEANSCVPSYVGCVECRAESWIARVLRATSSLPSRRLRDLEVHRACPESSLVA